MYPSLLSLSALTLTRIKPSSGSLAGSSNAVKTSLTSSFRIVLPPLTERLSVIEDWFIQMYRLTKCPKNTSSVTLPSPLLSKRLKMVFNCSSEKIACCSSTSSGIVVAKDTNFSSVIASSTCIDAYKSFGNFSPFFAFCFMASTMCCKNMPAVKSSLSSETRGAAVAVVVSSFFSSASIRSVASLSSRLPTNLCSLSRKRAFSLFSSFCNSVILSNCAAISVNAGDSEVVAFASFCLVSSCVLVSSMSV
mmetsp:Transcript_87908/g.152332  ORF Transcript_87908/g.152332 Transcript_87908/m.152332 type:complete len:249 (+) Transcript_87908:2298-3044(+)